MKRYSPELCNELMKEPDTRIEKDFGFDGMIMARLGEEIFRDPEYQEKKKTLKPKRVDPLCHCQDLDFWVEQFPDNLEMEIYSYGVWCCTPWTAGNFKAKRKSGELGFGDAIVKRIFKGDKGQVIFDTNESSVYLWNQVIVDKGSRIEYEQKEKDWYELPFSIDAYSKSKIQTDILKAREIRVRDLLETLEVSFRGEIWRVEVDGKNYANLSFDELNKKVNYWRIESYLEQRYYVQKLVIRTKGERKKVQETQSPQEIKAIPILYASSCWLRFPRD